ncbi:hypothetical protein NBO_386g0010 [Nosema bombycis CQ1]|uniref:DUF1764 domain-containing protein n=1 Tax=Nosema bombycis (strain CQ1 / CVCC 102059) TaxID=578461 RepID=R0MIM3_NOSB1|nr:hypothetical protein NBO_386g0010 [Nosema bombycis CQ1]|eukprot:EOB12653.1 hypothetical protein NBO_386g0010 [Nosema bombycis CQ1]
MDIDDIFKDIEKNKKNTYKQTKTEDLDEDDLKYLTNKSDRKFIDGLPIYTVEELKIGKGGDTEDCPFDCDCCY